MNVKTYYLHIAGKKIAVGYKKPFYNPIIKGWETDRGVFSTPNMSDYKVSAEIISKPAEK